MSEPIKNAELVDGYLDHHHPQLVSQGWRCFADPDTKTATGPYVVRLGLYSNRESPQIPVQVVEGRSENFVEAIRDAIQKLLRLESLA